MIIDSFKTELPFNDLRQNLNKKIAVLFRGPLRPTPYAAAIHTNLLTNELKSQGFQVTTYLATWMRYKNYDANDLISMGLYDNIIVQQPPTSAQVKRCTSRESYGIYPISNVYGMYYQSKTALDVITSADDYDYVVHSRTDLRAKFGKHVSNWFQPNVYMTPVNTTPWVCDWISVAQPDIMRKVWNYDNFGNLGHLIDTTDVPEMILMSMMKHYNITVKTAELEELWLDPDRNI